MLKVDSGTEGRFWADDGVSFSSPLLSPIVVGLLDFATFGWTLTAIYVLAALVVAVGAGLLLHTLGFEYVPDGDTREQWM